jgi:hypothetical protein
VVTAAAAALAALAFAGGALAAPTAPVLHPIPPTVTALTSTYTIAWDPSIFDLSETNPFVSSVNYYWIDVDLYRPPSPDPILRLRGSPSGTTYQVPLYPGDHYVVRVRGVQEGWCNWLGTWFECISPQVGPSASDEFDVVPIFSAGFTH